jgi:AcrR family transcriptional regulator
MGDSYLTERSGKHPATGPPMASTKKKSTREGPSPPDRRKLKGQQSRERILDAAVGLFSERGYAASGVEEIARRAGIEKAALYWHFGSKEGLLAMVLDRMDAEIVEGIVKRVDAGASDEERLDLFVKGLETLAVERGHLVRLMLGVALERRGSPESRAAIQRIFDRTRVAVERGFEQGLGVKLPGADLIARLALAYLVEVAVREAVDPEGADHARLFAHLRRLIALDVDHQLRGVKAEPGRTPKRS